MRLPNLTNICLFVFLLISGGTLSTFAQEQSQYDRGTPPQHAAGVSSLGSYSSTDLGSVNLSNGALNFKIPLATVGGRGFSIPLTLNYSSKVWSASMDTDVDISGQPFTAAYADYANLDGFVDLFERVGPGWTIGAAPMIFNRIVRINKLPPIGPSGGCYSFILPKLTVMLPDKGEIEFRDDVYDGAPLSSGCGSLGAPASRGRRWHATDGSGTIYISDNDNAAAQQFGDLSGVVITADGTRYRFTGSRCTSITDRNGNRIDITYTESPFKVEYKDQLGRITKVEQFVPDPDNPSVTLAILVTVPGYTGNHYIKIKRAVMSANYRSDISPPATVCTGTYDPLSKGYSTWCGSSPTLLFPHSYGLFQQRIDNQQVLTEVVLPDQRSLRFKYNVYGEVAEAQLPTGGKLWYDYEHQSGLPAGNSPSWEIGGANHTEVTDVDRALVQRRAFDGSALQGTWSYAYSTSAVVVVATSPTEEVLLNERHQFLPSGRYTDYIGGSGFHDGTQYSLWSTGIEWRTEMRNATGSTVLSAFEKDWTQRVPVSWPGYPQEQPANDNRVNQERRYLETGMMAKVETFYDQYNNATELKEYDYDQSLKRRRVISYISNYNGSNYQTDDGIHLLRLPETQTIYDGNGNQRGRTVTEYDAYSNDGNRDVLTSYSSVSQHDSSYGSSKTTRGNPTRVGVWLNTTGAFIYNYPRYDILGNVVSVKDARGNVSTISFADNFGNGSNPGTSTQNPATPTYALATLITSPAPAAGAPVQTARSQYDYSTGLLTGFLDRNNVVTQTIYDDPFNRPTLVKSAFGVSGVESHTAMYYAPATTPFGITLAKNDVLTAVDQTALDDGNLRSWTVTDGFGRTKETWTRDPQGDVKVETIYDALSRQKQVSNAFRPSLSETAVYSTTIYDLLGRVTSLTTPDGAAVSTSYNANSVTVTDQAGKARKSVTDALGRLIEVYEDPNGVNFQTSYLYDALDNLLKVTQGSQNRYFMYDSLKRLIRADNPEQETLSSLNLLDPITNHSNWTTSYEYDNSSNLRFKTDARGVITESQYDALNRITKILYRINGQPDPNTGDVEYLYDNATNGRGRLWLTYRWGAKPSQTAVGMYDALGRVTQLYQLFGDGQGGWSTGYAINRTYNRGGAVTSQSYPSGRTVTYNYDAAGRLADKDAQNPAFAGNLGDGVQRSYASAFVYNSRSQVTQELFGTQTPLYHKLQYNIRGQLWDVRVSTGTDVNGSMNRGGFQFFYDGSHGYGTSGPDNNGNVLFANTYIAYEQPGEWAIHRQSYDYDSLNRLKSVTEYFVGNSQAESQQSVQTYNYDRWGNRTITAPTWGTGINNTPFEIEAARNRLYSPGDTGLPENQKRIVYDKAGNQTKDTYTGHGSAVFDADNRITAIQDSYASWSYYTYNADGQRVRRNINNQETWQIYGIEGELLAEYAANGAVTSPRKEYGYRNGQLLISAEPAPPASGANVAAAANGAVAIASSTVSTFVAGNAINGDHVNGGMWADDTSNAYPDWIRVDFAGSKTISEIDVFGRQDTGTPVEPTPATTSSYALTNFEVQYWNGSDWATVPGTSVSGNNKVWSRFTFAPLVTSKIRVYVTNVTGDNRSQVVEIEAYGPVNVAAASNGAAATASSTVSTFVSGNAINGDHVNGGMWADDTSNTYPDWIRVDFAGSKTISEIDVFGRQDTGTPVEPTLATTSSYALTNFEVQYWNGSDWVTVPGGSVIGNNKVWCKFTFAPLTTSKIRVYVTNVAGDNRSQVVEIEAYTATNSLVQWLIPDHLGTPRIIVDQTGALASVKRHDYLPFGEELLPGTGGRTTAQGYSVADGLRQQFTAKERDVETGLDYFGARYYISLQGRFTSADPLLTSGRPANPQSWNRYSYVLNNPVRLTDPTGYEDKDETNPDQAQGKEPQQKPTSQPKPFDLRQDPNIVSAVQEIQENAAPLKKGERPVLTSVVVVPGQVSNLQDTKYIDAYGNVSAPFTGTIQPIAVIPLDQGCNIIPAGNGVLLQELITSVRGPDPGSSGLAPPPPNGVFIDIQNIGEGLPTVEINQKVKVQQGRIQIETGPNNVIKDAGAGTVRFTQGPQTKRVFQ